MIRLAILVFCTVMIVSGTGDEAQSQTPRVGPLIQMISSGSGPIEKIDRFERSPGKAILPLASIKALVAEFKAGDAAAQSKAIVDARMEVFGDTLGGVSITATLTEQLLQLHGLQSVNNALNWAGIVFTVVSAASDIADGNTKKGTLDTLKGYMSFAIERWGWGSLQVAGVSLYFLDITFREWDKATLAAGLDNFRDVYRASFTESGRNVNEWKRVAWDTYLRAEAAGVASRDPASNSFGSLMTAEIEKYTARSFTPEMLLNWEKSNVGLGMYGGQERVEKALAAEYAVEIQAMLLKDVYPEIAKRAGERNISQMLARLNGPVRNELNTEVVLEVTAFGLTGPAEVVIPTPDGKSWGGMTDSSGVFRMTFSKLSFLKAGLPSKLLLRHDNQEDSRDFRIAGNKVSVMFGDPSAALISRFRLTENERSCVYTSRNTQTSTVGYVKSLRLPALGGSTVDIAVLPTGTILFGRYDEGAGRWQDAAPGHWHLDTDLLVGPPYVGEIDKLSNCSLDFLTPAGKLGAAACTFWRIKEKTLGQEQLRLRCDNPGKLDLVGVFANPTIAGQPAEPGGGLKYFPLDGPEGQTLVNVLRTSMAKGIPGGLQ